MTLLAETTATIWLAFYDSIATVIDDGILDEVDLEYDVDFLVEADVELPDEYFIRCAQRYQEVYPHKFEAFIRGL